MSEQSTRHIMVMEPLDFHANPQTRGTNHFQHKDPDNVDAVRRESMQEFRAFRDTLVEAGVYMTTVQGQKGAPDDIYINNWISTHPGRKVLYPMLAPNRRIERRPDLVALLDKTYETALDLSPYEKQNRFLESTGALVMDRVNKIAYCALSERADRGLAEEWAQEMGYEMIFFRTRGPAGEPVYHTDVLMYIGSGYAGICLECIIDEDRGRVKAALSKTHEIIEISMDQLEKMAGNALEVKGAQDQKMLVMSSQAHSAYTDAQKTQIKKYVTRIIHSDLAVIERYGGGSARCMLLELY